MKLNKKGFTLIELLAVVVILLAISVIAISTISAAIERNKAKQDEAKKRAIVSIAELYYEENKNTLYKENGNTTTGCIFLRDLELSDDEKVDSNGNLFGGKVCYTEGKHFVYEPES